MFKQIFILVALTFILRIIFIPQGAVSFHYDMARDAYEAQKIYKLGDLKILGPPTSTPGLFHGVLYYYLIAVPYGLSQGNPFATAIFLSFISSLTAVPIFLLARDLFKSNAWASISVILFTLSFEAVQYGPWLSNPAPAMLTVVLFFYFLRLWQKGKVLGLYLATFSVALSVQFQFFLIYLFLLLPIFKYLFKIKVFIKEIGISLLITSFGLSTFAIGIIKFNSLGQILGGFLNISVNTQIDFRTQFSDLLLNYINRFADLFINNFFPVNVFLGGLLTFIVLYFLIRSYQVRKTGFILFCLLSNFPIFIFGGHSNVYGNVGLVAPAILAVLVLLRKLSSQNRTVTFAIFALIIVSNVYTIFKNSPKGQITLVIPNDMILANQLKLIDTTYNLAKGEAFSINSLTLPLWTNTTWAYLYSWYGRDNYGYVPSFYGHDQVGLLGENDLNKIEKPLDLSFFIIEPLDGIPQDLVRSEISTEDSKTKLINEINFGSLKLQVRTPDKNEE